MMKNRAAATPEFANSKTLVWWDMDNCPVPNGYDPSRLAPRIDTELKKLGYNGPLTIIAMGNLEGIPYDFLRALASTGVVIKHAGCGSTSVLVDILFSESIKESPVTLMVISHNSLVEVITSDLSERCDGYNFLVAYPPNSEPEEPHPLSLVICGEWLWNMDSLLKDSGSAEKTRGLVNGSHMFSCGSCTFHGPSFEDLTKHLETPEHARKIKLGYEDREFKFNLKAEEEAEARKKNKAKMLKDVKKLQMRRNPRRSKRLSKGKKNLEIGEEVHSGFTSLAEMQAKANQLKIEEEYMAHSGVLLL